MGGLKILFFSFLSLALLFSFFLFFFYEKDSGTDCFDGILSGTCLDLKPFFCNESKVVYAPEKCGCLENFVFKEGKCLSDFQTGPRKISFDYFLDGEKKVLEYEVYSGVTDYLSKLNREIKLLEGNYSREIFERTIIEEEIQKNFVLPLAIEIYNLGKNRKERIEIARTLVQLIPYEESKKITDFYGMKIPYTRYPYEVLYENKGICGDKSQLLYLILDYLGEDVVLFYFPKENHEGVGIKCRSGSFKKTGYCYIETTGLFKIGTNPSGASGIYGSFEEFEKIKV